MAIKVKKILISILAALVMLLLVAFVGAGLFLSQDKELEERHRAFPFDQEFDYSNSSFEDYQLYARRLIQAARVDTPSQTVIENLGPFIFEPDQECPVNENGQVENGIVLTHGLIASPADMRPIGEYFQSQCFYVLGLLIPDHSTRPGNFLDTHWEEWAQAQHFATEQLGLKAENIYLSGHSAGGTLAILEAATNPDVDAMVLFAPALSITPAAKYAEPVSYIGKVFPKAAWFDIDADEAIYRYESITFTAAAETYGLIMATEQAVADNGIGVPVLTVATVQDNTVGTQTILDFMEAVPHPASETVLYSQHPYPAATRVHVHISGGQEEDILSVSHLGLMVPPTHPYYGRGGEYRNCGHYSSQESGSVNEDFVRCKAGERDYYGEATAENLAMGIIERIAFNPFYEDMLGDIEEFVETISLP